MLTASAISKRFGRTLALDRVDFKAYPGEIHALLGENGAGKTTLMNIVAGCLSADSGTVALDGVPLTPGSPQAALRAGVAAVNQSPMLFERLTWEENLALGGFGRAAAGLDLAEVAVRAGRIADRLGFTLPPAGSTVEQRSVAERVRLEVIRALSFDPRVLILDEPTGVLAPVELGPFLDSIRRLRAEGRIVVLITHKLAEALAVADRVTVLRQGRVVASTVPSKTDEAALARLMVGELAQEPNGGRVARAPGETALEIEGLILEHEGRRVVDGLDLSVRRGEIFGIAGVDGNGQAELVAILAGARAADRGRVTVHSAAPGAHRMAVIPQNRDLDGLILDMTLWENLLLQRALRERVAPHGWLSRARAIDLCRELLTRFRIRADRPETAAGALSGGNRQRLEVARALAGRPEVLVAHDLTRGLDLAATAEVHRSLLEFAAGGGAVLMISSDLEELLKLSDRLAVMSRGRLREVAPEERNAERLGMLLAGAW